MLLLAAHMAHNSQSVYRPDIDGLRAIAVFAVVGYHVFPGIIRGGYVCVDIFFVISGFLTSSFILTEIHADALSIGIHRAPEIDRGKRGIHGELCPVGWIRVFQY